LSISVAVISSDMEYVTRMMSYMKGSPIYHTWRLQLYSSPERIHLLAELERAQLIVVEEPLVDLLSRRIEAGGGEVSEHTLITGHAVIPIIVLAAQRRELEQHELCKYQSLSSLLHSLQQRYEYYRGTHVKSFKAIGEKQRIIGICSTLEQTGKTVLALHMAALLASKGYRVFYFNLEQWNTSDIYLRGRADQGQPSYSDLLYLVKSKQPSKKWLAERVTAIAQFGFYTLSPFQHEADRQGLSSSDAKSMMLAVADSGLYDFVIVDFPAGINPWTLPLLQQCAAHYMLVLRQRAWQCKHKLALASASAGQQAAAMMQELQLESWSIVNELNGGSHSAIELTHQPLEILPYVEAWQAGDAVLLSSAGYRAAVERCIAPLLQRGEKAGGLSVG